MELEWNDAAVYADDAFIQVLSWKSSLCTAALVRPFPPRLTSKPSVEPLRCVLLISSHLSKWAKEIHDIVSFFPYRDVLILTLLSESLHTSELDVDESLVGVWSGSPLAHEGYFDVVCSRITSWIQEELSR